MTERTHPPNSPTPPEGAPGNASLPAAAPLTLDPAQTADRETLFPMHPVLTRRFHIVTPPLRQAFDLAVETIASGAPGCAFIAYSRFGKTWASEYMAVRLAEVFPKMPIIMFRGDHHIRPTERQFIADLLHQTCHEVLPKRAASPSPLYVLARAWWTLVQCQRASHLILIGDEMQKLTSAAYSWLVDVTNELHRLKVQTTMISFAQPELVDLRTALLITRRGDIVGRFLTRLRVFEGITSSNQLREVMNAYDDFTNLEYPADSGWSFSRFFLPRAFANGWRLAACAGECWEQFKQLSTQRLKSPERVQRLSVGMEWVAGTMQNALLRFNDFDRPDFAASSKDWRLAIERSGFLDSLGLTYDPQWSGVPQT